MYTSESDVEKAFKDKAEEKGCLLLKITPDGEAGWPDRLLLLPGGITCFIEFKRPGETLRPLQERRKSQLNRLGQLCFVISTLEEVREFWR